MGFHGIFFTLRRDALWMNHPGEVQSSGYLIHSLDNFKHFSKQPHPQTYVFKTITIILQSESITVFFLNSDSWIINMNVNNKYLYSVVKYYSIFVGKYMCSCSFNKHLGTFCIYNIHVYLSRSYT